MFLPATVWRNTQQSFLHFSTGTSLARLPQELPVNSITKASSTPGCPENPGQWAGDATLVTAALWCFSWRRQRPQAVDGERGPRGTRALQGDHLLRGLLQPARGRLRQRDRRGAGKRGCQVRHPGSLSASVHKDWVQQGAGSVAAG